MQSVEVVAAARFAFHGEQIAFIFANLLASFRGVTLQGSDCACLCAGAELGEPLMCNVLLAAGVLAEVETHRTYKGLGVA